jgi:subtilisin family serine protease
MENLTVVYIHGIGNKPAPEIFKESWDKALFGTKMGARTRLAYWADIRYPQPIPPTGQKGSALAIAATADLRRPLSDAEIIEESKLLVPDTPEAQAFAEAAARQILNQESERAIRARQVQAKLRLLPDPVRGKITEWVTTTFIQDAAAYFFDAEQKAQIQQRLRQILIPEKGPYVVIGHSMGSIIAYDVLRQMENAGLEVPLLVTLGSPLAIEAVKDNVVKPWQVPQQVRSWKNFCDAFDAVAFDKDLNDDFDGSIVDLLIENAERRGGVFSFFDLNAAHSGVGYLSTKAVQQAVQEVVGTTFAQPIASFVIARDVAAEMAGPIKRIPVLIELSDEIAGATSVDKQKTLINKLQQLTNGSEEANIDPLRRYVAANLTPEEIDRLSAQYKNLPFARIWKNTQKRALLETSTHTVQAHTAQLGYGATGRGISWAILDTGINANHPHFYNYKNIVQQWDCTQVGEPPAGNATDRNGHGTHVAGIIAGTGRDEHETLRGMAPEAKLHIYKVLDDEGFGNDSWIIKALDHIASVNDSSPNLVIHGVNLSLGGSFDPTVYGCGHSPICRELRRLWRQGVVVCIAAGNEGRILIETLDGSAEVNLDLSIGDPANLEDAIAVGSVHKSQPHTYGISYFSSRGPTADGRAKPDLVAPGERIISANAHFSQNPQESEYVEMSGTSMACPHVSGIIAAFLSVRQEFIGYPDRVKEILLSHCTDLKRDRYHQGAGMPNLVKMLSRT